MSGQNTSTAVMAARREPKDSLDDFPTPPWAGRALCEHVIGRVAKCSVWDPAANRGFLLRGLGDHFWRCLASDIAEYPGWVGPAATAAQWREDFLFARSPDHNLDWIVTNPPFRLAARFVRHALALRPRRGVAMFVRTAFLESETRWRLLFRDTPPDIFAQFAERVVLLKGRCLDPDVPVPVRSAKTGRIEMKKPSTATAYCWLVWLTDGLDAAASRRPVWIPPCRRRLARPGDYDPPPARPAGKATEG